MITDAGIEGGPVYAHSADVRDALDAGACTIVMDLHPDLSVERPAERIKGRRPKDSVSTWLRHAAGLSPWQLHSSEKPSAARSPTTRNRLLPS